MTSNNPRLIKLVQDSGLLLEEKSTFIRLLADLRPTESSVLVELFEKDSRYIEILHSNLRNKTENAHLNFRQQVLKEYLILSSLGENY